MEPGHDINITRVWQSNITGMGVVVAVVDDGEWEHVHYILNEKGL